MDRGRGLNVEDVLQAALLTHPVERAGLLTILCQGDAALRAEVEFCLAAHEEAQRLLAESTLLAQPSLAGLPVPRPHNERNGH